MLRPAAALLLAMALAPAARAEEVPRVPLRVGSHADHGRLVFDWPRRVGYGTEQSGDRLLLRFEAPGQVQMPADRRLPRNVTAVAQDGQAVEIRTVPGARLRFLRLGNRIVVDVLDPARLPAEAGPARPVAGDETLPLPLPPPAAPPRGAAPATTAPPAAAPSAGAALADAAAPHAAPPASPHRAAPEDAAAPAPTARPASAPTPAPASAAMPTPPPAATPSAAPGAPSLPPATATPRPAASAAPSAGALPVRVRRDPTAIAVPAGADTGLALFRRGEVLHIVFDRLLDLDLSSLRDHPVFGALEAVPIPEATLLRLRLAPPVRLAARREGDAWVIAAVEDAAPADAPALRVVTETGPPARLVVQGAAAGGAVAFTDPDTGESLLAATLREPGPGVAVARRLPELEVLPSMMGVAVLPRADRVVLRALPDRILAEGAGGAGLALGAPGQGPPPQAAAMSRLLDLAPAPVPALLERLRLQLTAVNETPPLARGPRRRAAAETLLALGLPQEAQAMAALGLREDPQAREDARHAFVHGVAALLSGRPGEARGIADARLPAADEVALWRGLLAAAHAQPEAAAALVPAAPLALAYPEALRERVLPLLAETLAAGGQAAPAARLLAEAAEVPGLALARALLHEAEGRQAAAREGFAAIARGRDRRQRAVALRRLAELRLAAGEIDAAGAAEALDSALFAWRGGAEEVGARRRIAALRLQAGQGPAAFALLDETARLFPDHAAAFAAERAEAFAAALENAPPVVAATLFDAHPDLMPGGERGEATVLLLADRLAALDLPQRAAALLDRAATRAEPPVRAAIGARLAALRAAEGDAAGTLAALDASAAPALPEALATRRALLRARAQARTGARGEAEAALAALGPAGAEARAELRAEARDWPGAAAAQMEHLAAALPAAPAPLDAAARTAVARAAAYAALAGDEALLAALREAHGARMAGGPLEDAFALLTADPLRGLADLPRLQREIGLLRALPTRLEALRGGVQVAR